MNAVSHCSFCFHWRLPCGRKTEAGAQLSRNLNPFPGHAIKRPNCGNGASPRCAPVRSRTTIKSAACRFTSLRNSWKPGRVCEERFPIRAQIHSPQLALLQTLTHRGVGEFKRPAMEIRYGVTATPWPCESRHTHRQAGKRSRKPSGAERMVRRCRRHPGAAAGN